MFQDADGIEICLNSINCFLKVVREPIHISSALDLCQGPSQPQPWSTRTTLTYHRLLVEQLHSVATNHVATQLAIKQMLDNIANEWLLTYSRNASLTDRPNYFTTSPQTLISQSRPLSYTIGNGHQIFTSSIIPECLETEHELILVTCFWARSTTRDAISALLRKLSKKALARQDGKRITVRICFSSVSIWQKLFQTSSLDGKVYDEDEWAGLGLPSQEELRGLDLVVKSIFVRPFGVMHPKFVVIDREKAFMPSCNVSWESWFEGCIEMKGEICLRLLEFYNDFWTRGSKKLDESWTKDYVSRKSNHGVLEESLINSRAFTNRDFAWRESLQTILLPSQHHINPRFSPFSQSIAPPTPLNTFILQAISQARTSIYIQTPNLTCRPLIRALIAALKRGVNITITTSQNLMILEQLVTAFTITSFEIWKLQRAHARLSRSYLSSTSSSSSSSPSNRDIEAQLPRPGDLWIQHFTPKVGGEGHGKDEVVKSHLKLLIVDQEVTVLGSGNMDRASWFTSQELGVAVVDGEFARSVGECTEEALEGRIRWVYR